MDTNEPAAGNQKKKNNGTNAYDAQSHKSRSLFLPLLFLLSIHVDVDARCVGMFVNHEPNIVMPTKI